MQETTNLKLKKPELTDAPPDITVLNHNWDTLDTDIDDLQENKADKDLTANKYLTNVTNSDFLMKSQSAGVAIEVREVSANYTLSLLNAGDLLKCTNSDPITITVPTHSNTPFPIGTVIEILRYGAGYVAIKAADGVTLGSSDSTTPLDPAMISNYEAKDIVIPMQYKSAVLKKIDDNEWVLPGDVYRIKSLLATFTASGNWPVPAGIVNVDAFVVGGGGGGDEGGGGGGYCKLYQGISVTPSASIPIIIGGGGEYRQSGGYSQFLSSTYRANGGTGSTSSAGAAGGSGGGGGGNDVGGDGGSNGSDGIAGTGSPAGLGGAGGGTADYVPINPYNNTRYGGGGGGGGGNAGGAGKDGGGNGASGSSNGKTATANTGSGGGGHGIWGGEMGGFGGSGICLIYG